MSITVRRIQDDIVNPEVRLSDILRKAKVLAYRLDLPNFKRWVEYELDGYYGEGVEVPDYRSVKAYNIGHFSGFAGAQLRNYPIPTLNLPKWVQERVHDIEMREGVASLESMARSSEEVHHYPWPANLVAMVGEVGRIIHGYALVSAQQPIPRSAAEAILDTVRNRLLTFLLELEGQFPKLAESEEATRDIPREQARAMFHSVVIHGGQNVIASGSQVAQTVQPSIPPQDLIALLEYVRGIEGVSEEDIIALREAVEEDEAPPEHGRFGARVTAWLGRMATKTLEGASTTAASQTVQHATRAIAQYYGLPLS